MKTKSNNEPNIYISTGLVAIIGASTGYLYETARQHHLLNASQEKADTFINNTFNSRMKEKYQYITDNKNSSNKFIKNEVKKITRGLKQKTALTFSVASLCGFTLWQCTKAITKHCQKNKQNNK